MFDTTYVHPLLRNSMVLWHYYHWYIKTILWLSSGTTAGMDQWIGGISPERDHPSKSKISTQPSLDLDFDNFPSILQQINEDMFLP